MPTAPQIGKDLINEIPEGQRIKVCLEAGKKVQCSSCGSVWMQTDICYSCPGTVYPVAD